MNRKESLHRLVLEWSLRVFDPQDKADDGTVLEELQPYSNLKELQLERGEYRLLRKLNLSCCPRLQTLPSQLPKLEEVKIKKCDSHVALPETTTLKIVILVDNLVLEDWREDDKTYKDLWDLNIIGCPKLKGLPQRFTPKK